MKQLMRDRTGIRPLRQIDGPVLSAEIRPSLARGFKPYTTIRLLQELADILIAHRGQTVIKSFCLILRFSVPAPEDTTKIDLVFQSIFGASPFFGLDPIPPFILFIQRISCQPVKLSVMKKDARRRLTAV